MDNQNENTNQNTDKASDNQEPVIKRYNENEAQPIQEPVQVNPAPVAQSVNQIPVTPISTTAQTIAPAVQSAPVNQAQPSTSNPATNQVPAAQSVSQEPVIQTPLTAEKKKSKTTNTKKLIALIGGLGAFFFMAFIIMFFLVSQSTNPENNPFIQVLGIQPEDWIPFLINITSAGFGFIVFIAFIVAIIGIFKVAMAKKDDKSAKTKGFIMTAIGALMCVVLIVMWMFVYLNLSSKRVDQESSQVKDYIITDPELTFNLTAPMEITFDASALDRVVDSKSFQILSYEWDFGDDSGFATGQKVSHLYTKKGSNGGRYKVVLTLTFKNLKEGTEEQNYFEKDIVFSNELATTIFTSSPSSGAAPLRVTFDASDSRDEDGSITDFAWDFDEDGFYDDADGKIVEYTYQKIGTYTAKLRTTDSNGQTNISEQKIEVLPGSEPKAFITVNSDSGNFEIGKSYLFDASKSSSPTDAKIVKYSWSFGDGSTANTRTANHSYTATGTYLVNLSITDEDGFKAEDEFEITIIQPKSGPEAVIKPSPGFSDQDKTYIEGVAPFSVSFSALDSVDPDDDIVEYQWDFDGDGVVDDNGEVVSYVFKKAGDYNVILTVIDADENQSKKAILVQVEPHGLLASLKASPVQGEAPLIVGFDASGSLYPEGDIISYEWDFGDGSKRVDIAQITYTYKSTGTYTASVTAVAADGQRSTATVVISVRPVSVKACFEMSQAIGEAPLTVSFNPSCSTGTVTNYFWDFGNGKTSRDNKPTTEFKTPGNYTIKLEVRDGGGVTSTITQDLVVTGEF